MVSTSTPRPGGAVDGGVIPSGCCGWGCHDGGASQVRRQLVGWFVVVAILGGPAAMFGILTSPAAWWNEGPFDEPFCFELTNDRANGASLAAFAAWPLIIGAAATGMAARARLARGAGQVAGAFPVARSVATGLVVVLGIALTARALFEAGFRSTTSTAHDECLASLAPSAFGWACGIVAVVLAAWLGTRALDYA